MSYPERFMPGGREQVSGSPRPAPAIPAEPAAEGDWLDAYLDRKADDFVAVLMAQEGMNETTRIGQCKQLIRFGARQLVRQVMGEMTLYLAHTEQDERAARERDVAGS